VTAPPLGRVRACVFDAYGTLLDVASPVAAEAAALGARAGELAKFWRQKQLEYTWLRSLMRRHADFEQVTGDALDHAMEALAITDGPLRSRLIAAYRRLATYADVRPALLQLRARGISAAILSNGSAPMLADGLVAAGIADLVDPVRSVDEIGVFKPAPEVYHLATERLGLTAAEIAFVSSNGWDVHGAASFGLRSTWVNRGRLARDHLPGRPVRVIGSLAELADLLGPA
jgi:2-haloacid dehalogenase